MTEVSDTCWICLGEGGDLRQVCSCPSRVHQQCLSKWQLHNIGKPEECRCRFCGTTFPDWRDTYKSEQPRKDIIFKVLFQGEHKPVSVNPDDIEGFQRKIKEIFDIPQEIEMDIRYICNIPDSTEVITFEANGTEPHAYQSAAYLAANYFINKKKRNRVQIQAESTPNNEDESAEGVRVNNGIFEKSLWGYCVSFAKNLFTKKYRN